MTVRFVARLAIAIATIASTAIPSWGQIARVDAGVATAPAASARRTAQAPAAPKTLEGTWVSDDQPIETAEEFNGGQYQTGGPEYGGPEYGDPQDDGSQYGSPLDQGDGTCDPDAVPCEDPAGAFNRHLGKHGCLGCLGCPMDLWDEVHAHRRMWLQVDYLSMWAKGNNLPPLVTTSPIGTPQTQAGVLPVSATTSILYGDGRVNLDQRNGARIGFGYWLVDGEFFGIEGQYFALERGSSSFNASSNFSSGDPNAIILARPFTNYDPIFPSPTNDSKIIAYPQFQIGNVFTDLDGSINVQTSSQIQSAAATFRRLIWIGFEQQRRLDFLFGYRFFRYDNGTVINDATTINAAGIIPTTFQTSQDLFGVHNQFNGGEIGLKGQNYFKLLELEWVAKVAFGNMRQSTYINGFRTTAVDGGDPTTEAGGFLTAASNMGSYRRDVFAILPEANVNLKLNITCNLRATMGYTFIYTNRVQTSGDAISLNVNPVQPNGPLVPAFSPTDSTFWVHGVNAGMEYRW
jgi:hypothetical protein